MNTVIYYPHFYPTPEWLKLAALCWDKVYRMKSPDALYDPEPIRELDQILDGILDSIDVARTAADPEVQDHFWKWVEARADKLKAETRASREHPLAALFPAKFPGGGFVELLHERGLAKVQEQPVDVQIPEWEKGAWDRRHAEELYMPPEPGPGSAYEKYNRLKEEAREKRWVAGDREGSRSLEEEAEKIRQQNLITVTDYSHLIYLPKDIALYYLSLCASKAATDGKRDLVANGKNFTDVVFHNVRVLRGEVATSVLRAYLPRDLFSLDPQRVAEFRSEFAAERLKYQQAVQSIVREFAEVASEGELGALKQRIVDLAKERVEETRKTYRRAKLDMMIRSFGISLTPPAIATSLASALGIGIFAPAGIAAALSIFAAKSLIEWDRAREERSKSPWSYVLDSGKIL